MSSDDVDDPEGLSQDPDGTLDTVERAMAELVTAAPTVVQAAGAQVGRYVLSKRLGAGAMGVVWEAHDPQLDRKVALKILRRGAHGGAGSQAADRAAREARALARLVHPNIVAVHDGGLDGETLYVVMEYVDGVTLRGYLGAERRSLDEIIDAFVQAGEGLAAAHDAKLVHRDFKPDNVLVGRDGRVRVADFGLARMAGAADAPLDGPTPTTTPEPQLTATAAVVGTLAYMAPEQLERGAVDHRADQFAFAVSWWSALYGAEPFSGSTIPARRDAIAAGPVARSTDRKVPGWLQAVLRRALARDPEARFRSMRALLDAVARGRGRRRRITLVASSVAAVAVVASSMWWARGGDGPEPCRGAAEEIARVWNPARGDELAAAFPAHAAGRTAAANARGHVDAYTIAWTAGHTAACRATAVDHTQSEDLLDRRMACFARARSRLDALLTSVSRAGAVAADEVARAIDELPSLEICDDVVALAAVVPLPDDPDARRRVEAASAELDQLSAGVDDPTHPIHLDDTAKALADARAAGWAPLIAEAAMVHATALDRDTQPEPAAALYLEAVTWALQGADDRLATRALADLAWAVGARGKESAARSWLALARAMSRRLGDPKDLLLQVTTTAGELARELGDLEGALTETAAALVLASGPDVPPGKLGNAVSNVGLAHVAAGHYDIAVEHLRRGVELARVEVGPDHPLVADRLQLVGIALADWGHFEESRVALTETIRILEGWYGRDDLKLMGPLQTLSALDQRAGKVEASRPALERALAIAEAHPGVDPAQRIQIEANLAVLEAQLGNFEVALERGAASLAALEAVIGPDDPGLIEALILVGYVERALGRLDASAEHLRRAVTVAEHALGDNHPAVANPRIELANTEVARGRTREAIALYERVIGDGERDPNIERRSVAEASLALADVLAQSGALPRARKLAASARDLYAAIEGQEPQRDAAAAWLAAH